MRIQIVAAACAVAVGSATAALAAEPLQIAYVTDTEMSCNEIAAGIAEMDVIAITHGQAAARAELAPRAKSKKPAAEDPTPDRVETAHMRRLFLTGLYEGRCRPAPAEISAVAAASVVDSPAAAAKAQTPR